MRRHGLAVALIGAVITLSGLTVVPVAAAANVADGYGIGVPVVKEKDGLISHKLPKPTSGPACTRDYYAAGGATTSVQNATFDKSRRPIVYVHGWTGSADMWTKSAGVLESQLKDSNQNLRTQNFLYDYSADSIRWANSDKIAACLGQYISEIGESWKAAGGDDGKVLVVAHSMGGLATLYSSTDQFAQYPSAGYLGGVVTLDTPYLGSFWGGFTGVVQLKELVQRVAKLQFIPLWSSDAGLCLQYHVQGGDIPPPCAQPLPPPLPSSVPLTAIQGNITVDRKLFGVKLYSIGLGSDGIVSVDSQKGYADMFATAPQGGAVDTSRQDGCSITTAEILGAVGGPVQAAESLVETLYNLGSDGFSELISLGDNQLNGQDKSHYLNQLATTAQAVFIAPCSHINIARDESALKQTTEALKLYLDQLAPAVDTAQLAADSPYRMRGYTEGQPMTRGIGDSAYFTTPSGNITCTIEDPALSSSVFCKLKEHTFPSDPRPDGCTSYIPWQPEYVTLTPGGVRAGGCVGDVVTPPVATTLQYGDSITNGRFTCSSAESGVTCTDNPSGHTFTVSRSQLQRDGTVSDSAASTVSRTEIVHVKPVDDSGNILSGYTLGGEPFQESLPGVEGTFGPSQFGGSAYEATVSGIAGGELKSCWPSPTAQLLYCLQDPTDTEVLSVTVVENAPLIPPVSDLDPSVRPSQIQLDDGDVCSARTHGATTLRVTYICDDETKSTIGEVDKSGPVWTIQQVDGVSSVDEIPDKNNPPTRTAEIVKAWMNG